MKECVKYNYVGILPLKIRVGLNSKRCLIMRNIGFCLIKFVFPFIHTP